jgi:6-phosphogluconolactonase
MDFGRVDFFWGDERCVPPDSPQSNYGMAQSALLDAVRPSPERVHRLRGEDDPERAAAEYESALRAFCAASAAAGESSHAEMPRFDLVLLGMGPDGHTASLFPGSSEAVEAKRWVVATRDVHGDARRLTMTLPLLNAARKVAFLVVGADKAERVKEVLGPSEPETPPPARLVRPTQGELLWFLDAAAAARLETTA